MARTNNAVNGNAVNNAAVMQAMNAAAAEQAAQQTAVINEANRVIEEANARVAAAERKAAEAEANLNAARQAELDRMRAAKEAEAKVQTPAPEVAAHAQAVQPEAAHVNVEDLMADFKLPSIKRVLIGALLGLASTAAVGYGIGCVLSYALAGIVTLTAAPFIAFALSVLSWVIALYAGWKLGGYIGGKVFSSVVMPDGLAARSYASVMDAVTGAKDRAVGLFSVDKEELAAQVVAKFSGAHTVKSAA
jgi:hypothetical protein